MRIISALLLSCVTVLAVYNESKPWLATRAVQQAMNSVVYLNVQGEEAQGSCSGIVVAENRVLTAKHCVFPHIWVDGKAATVQAIDEFYDLAMLNVETARPAIAVRFSDVRAFEPVTGIGYAFGWTQLVAISARVVLPNLAPAPSMAPGVILQTEFIGGMSGGPVVDINGRLVSIVQQGNRGVSHGVSLTTIRAFLLLTDVRL